MKRNPLPIDRITGVVLASISAACFGTLGILGRYAYADGLDASTMLLLRFSFATLIMAAILVVRKERLPTGSTLLKLIGMGALGYTFQGLCYLMAVKYASPGLVALLLYLYPVLVAGLSVLLLKEKLGKVKIAALLLALAGTALTVNPQGGQLLGALYAIGAAIIYSVYIIVGTQVMRSVSVFQSSTVIFASASVSIGIITLINHGPQMPNSSLGWLAILGIVFVSTIIPVVTFLASLQRIGPTNASMLSTLEPVVTVLLSALLLGDRLSFLTLAGGALILSATLILTTSEISRQMN